MEEVVIIGGGVAGLACLNALMDLNISATLIEGSTIGTPKLCGEFIAPAAVAVLKKWNIGPIETITQTQFNVGCEQFSLNFDAGACSRSEVELQLAQRARALGATILENTRLTSITSISPFELVLQNNQLLKSKYAIFAAGKLNNTPTNFPYNGFKFHFEHDVYEPKLKMFSHKNMYYGIVPISQTLSNCVGLMKRSELAGETCRNYFEKLTGRETNNNFFETQIPEFSIKKNPVTANTLWIGDAYASLHPAIGYGFANSILTAINAADFIKNNKQALNNIKHKFVIAKLLHSIYLNPFIAKATVPLIKSNPWIASFILKKLNYN